MEVKMLRFSTLLSHYSIVSFFYATNKVQKRTSDWSDKKY